ncbi:MAG: hypothetical protein C7B45_12725 [Sulfobacillus acidophilus]|uniref:Zinc chelation protein SecC n=1 Tax=Sulfobacillus acidophilus TaxID=53633 RepID=A0A2T2WFD8_9FIRM|nr:MAG: hypothetical protein C7B45_12725 [Sulfobacillus acidophilus]
MSVDSLTQQNQQSFARVWGLRGLDADALKPEERHLLRGMQAHRALYPLWDRLNHLDAGAPVIGSMNPIAHTIMHAILEAQIEDADPSEVNAALEDLMQAGFSRNEALHVLGSMLALELGEVVSSNESYNDARYRGRIALIRQQLKNPEDVESRLRKMGRNERCLCGSGKKFKKCCLDHLPVDLKRSTWAFVLNSDFLYAVPSFMAQGGEDELFVLLQSLSAVVQTLEQMGDEEGAWHALEDMLELGKDDEAAVEDVCQDIVDFALNHYDFAERALAILDQSHPYGLESNDAVQLTWDLDRADLLARAGRVEESAAIYQQALERWQNGNSDVREILMNRWDLWKSDWQPQ